MKAEVNCGTMAVSGIEHPVRVIGSSDEEDDPDPWKQSGGAKSDEMYHVIGVHDSDWSIQDQGSLMRVNVELDNDDNYDDGDDDDGDDDDNGRSSGRCSEGNKTASAADLFWSADDSSLDIRGHQAKYEMEVVEQEATRTSIVLMPNTTLSDDEEHDDDVDATPEVEVKKEFGNLEQTVVRIADLSIAGSLGTSRGNVNMSTQPQEVVMKMNFGTQTLRHRSTQTNVDQSTQAGQGRIQKRGTKTLPRDGLPRSEEPRRRYGMQEQRDKFSGMYSKDPHVTTDDIRQRETDPTFLNSRRNEKKDFGQQTLANSFTQTPLLIRLNGGCGDPEGLKFGNALCSFDFANDGELLLQPLILPTTHDSGDRHLARVHQTDKLKDDVISRDPDDVMSRDFATQTFGQMSNSVDDVQTQTESGSTWNAVNHTEELEAISSSDIVQTKSSHRKTGSKELLNENEHGIKKGTKSKGIKNDESRKKLLKFMLDQVRKLRDEADSKGPRPHKGSSHKHHRGTHEMDMVEAIPVRSKINDDKQKRN